jgi:hypothetical protein
MAVHSYIVIKNQAELLRGSLVKLERGEYYNTHSHVMVCRHRNRVSISSSDLAPLTEIECVILDAVASDSRRYALYSTPGKLKWAAGLRVGDTLLAELPDKSSPGDGQEEYTTAILKWAGIIDGGWTVHHFGVEITVSCPSFQFCLS